MRKKANLSEWFPTICAGISFALPPLNTTPLPADPVMLTFWPLGALMFVIVAVTMVGVTMVGDVSTTNFVPVPVWLAIDVAFPDEVMTPVRFAFVVTLPAVRPLAVPVKLVAVIDDGVPPAPLKVTKAPADPTLMPSAVMTPVPVVVVDGATPAPPPIISAFAARSALVAMFVVELK